MKISLNVVRYNFPTRIWAGPGSRKKLSEELQAHRIQRPLIVTDRGIAGLPFIAEIRSHLETAGMNAGLFSEIWGNPVQSQVSAGVDAFRKHHADAIIAIGGGAAMDVAKVIGLMVHHPGDLFDYEDGKPDARPVDREIPFIACLPTTAGTGSEVGRASVVSDDRTHQKKIIFDPKLLAKVVLADPELLLNLSPKMTAATGIDALTHLIEAYLAKGFHPICDGIALEGVRLVSQSLERCVRQPQDLEARTLMSNAAMMGAIAFQKGLGAVHSCAHALSTVTDMHHGLANGILFPYVMKFNFKDSSERFRILAEVIGTRERTAESFIPWLEQLIQSIGIPKTLSEAGVQKSHLPDLVKYAYLDGCHQSNPTPVTEKDFRRIFEEALG